MTACNSTPYPPARRGEKRESLARKPSNWLVSRAETPTSLPEFHAVPAGTARREERESIDPARRLPIVLTGWLTQIPRFAFPRERAIQQNRSNTVLVSRTRTRTPLRDCMKHNCEIFRQRLLRHADGA